jgi:lincosamide nucleotidyltransferase A/C/D/E
MRSFGPGRQPREEMTATHAVEILDLLEGAEIEVWLDGGWAVDAVLQAQRRSHDDLDLIVRLSDVERLQDVLEPSGFELAGAGAPKSFELVDGVGSQVDVHPVVFSHSGDARFLMDNDEYWIYPTRGFAGRGLILDRGVRCLTPEIQMLCHTGYTPHRSSYDDVWALSETFGIPVPDEYREPRETYSVR